MIGLTNAGGGIDYTTFRVYNVKSAPSTPKKSDIKIDVPSNNATYEIVGKGMGTPTDIYHVRIYVQENTNDFLIAARLTKNTYSYLWFCDCKYYDGSKAKSVNAWFYDGSRWRQFSTAVPEWDGTLFYNGNQYTKYTGGWTAVGSGAKVGTNLTLDTGGFAGIRSTSKVDVTKFKTLRFKCATKFNVLGSDHSGFGLKSDGIGWSNCDDNFAAALWNLSGKTEGSLNISSITGSYYVTFFVYPKEGNAGGVDVNKIWLE